MEVKLEDAIIGAYYRLGRKGHERDPLGIIVKFLKMSVITFNMWAYDHLWPLDNKPF